MLNGDLGRIQTVEKLAEIELGTQLAKPCPEPVDVQSVRWEKHSEPLRDALPWHAVQIRYRFEKKAAEQLQRKEIETFLPMREEIHQWSDRHQQVRVPLFSGYAFVRILHSRYWRTRVLSTPGVIGFVSFQGEAIAVPRAQIEHLQLLLSEKVPCSLYPFLSLGQRVRIRGGCLHGVEGILTGNGTRHLVISIESIHRSIAIEIDGYELEPI